MSNETMTLKVIAHIHTAFPTKFGIPRQSGLVDGLRGEIIFTPEYRNADALRVKRRIFAQRIQPRIIPAERRLQLFAGDHESA